MNKLTQALMEELTVEYVKVGSLQIPESVVISWVIMLLLVVGSILLTRNLKVDHISKRQAALEALYSLGKNFFEGLLGKEGSRYVPYLMTVALYIACSNVIGVFGVKPPTEAAAALTTAQDKLRNVDNEAAARREAYEKQAEVEKQQLLADAQKQADEIVAAGKAAVEIERQNKLREADAQATALARSMCEKLLKHNLTAQDDDQLLDDLLQKAGAGNGN